MHKKVFMYGFLTLSVCINATDLFTAYGNMSPAATERIGDRSENANHCCGGIRRDLVGDTQERVESQPQVPTLKVLIPENGPIEATFSLSEHQTLCLTGIASVALVCCTIIATQHPQLLVHLFQQELK